jgi:hypothetical protein
MTQQIDSGRPQNCLRLSSYPKPDDPGAVFGQKIRMTAQLPTVGCGRGAQWCAGSAVDGD